MYMYIYICLHICVSSIKLLNACKEILIFLIISVLNLAHNFILIQFSTLYFTSISVIVFEIIMNFSSFSIIEII